MAKLARGTLALFSALELLQVRNKEGIIKKKKKIKWRFQINVANSDVLD